MWGSKEMTFSFKADVGEKGRIYMLDIPSVFVHLGETVPKLVLTRAK